MPFRISCAACDEVISAPSYDELPKWTCPHCGEDYRVPMSTEPITDNDIRRIAKAMGIT